METTTTSTTTTSSPNPNVFTYTSPHPIYAFSFSSTPSPSPPRLALGSFLENLNNHIHILDFDSSSSFLPSPHLSLSHPYPPTKLQFSPLPHSPLLASSSDFLRLFHIGPDSSRLHSLLNNSKSCDYSAPLTSFDWNPLEPRRIGTSSIDTTCTVWDVDRGVVETQLIAHDKEVYDIAWGDVGVFASVSADGSVRIFDLRDKEHSTIVYESPRPETPLLRLAWNRADLRFMAVTAMDSSSVVVLDIRSPAVPVAELKRHLGCVNAVAWAPRMPRHICSAGDDGQALIWELPEMAGGGGSGSNVVGDEIDPSLVYSAGSEINQLQWSAAHPDWIGIAFADKVQLLRV